jgi:NAD(P)H-hydrate epimerase
MNTNKYVSVAEMISIEQEANRKGLTYDLMMENAGRGLAEVVHARYENFCQTGILGLVGSGNNGGDTLVALAYLAEWGWDAKAYIVRPREADDPLVVRLLHVGGVLVSVEDDPEMQLLDGLLSNNSVLLDGILGTGIRLPLRGQVAEILAHSKILLAGLDNPPIIVAVDCPSGIDCDNGDAADESLPADLTVTMAAYKQGLLKFPAYKFVGDLELVGIGLSENVQAWQAIKREVITSDIILSHLPDRPLDAHKGTFGTAMIVSGCINFSGAALLAGEAAHRVGAGLVTVAVPESIYSSLAGHFREATWLVLPQENGVISETAAGEVLDNLGRTTAMLIGPGFGLADTTREFLLRILSPNISDIKQNPPQVNRKLPQLVIDADGLKLLASIPEWESKLPGESILTPHPGEMAILTGLGVSEIQADRVGIAERFAREWEQIVVLKGAFTVIAAPDGRTAIIPIASPSLARAGTGDVLAGLIVGLNAQGVEAYTAAVIAAWLHAQGGLLAENDIGNSACVLAGDVLRGVVKVLGNL